MFQFIYYTIPKFRDNILQNLNKGSLNIIHFQIGSRLYHPPNSLPNNHYNHEYPKIIDFIHNKPSEVIDPQIFYSNKDLTINQISYMIDSAYSIEKKILGYPDDFQFKNGKCNLQPVIMPSNITYEELNDIIKYISGLEEYKILINIIDFTSSISKELFATNKSNKIHITFPNCLANDTDIKYIPTITEDFDIIPNGIRWVNYRDDSHLLNEFHMTTIKLSDVNYYHNMYNFLMANNLEFLLYNRLLGCYKLWALIGYTNDNTLSNGDIINFNKLTSNEILELLKYNEEFKNLVLSRTDNYFYHNIMLFLEYFINKYYGNIQNNSIYNNLDKLLKIEAFDILELIYLCKSKEDEKIIRSKIEPELTKYKLSQFIREECVSI